jgi:hypothetical protein
MESELAVVLARFEGPDDARKAFTTLQNQGVDAADIRIGGDRASAVQSEVTEPAQREQLDHQLEGFVLRRVVKGALIGGAAGAALGAAIAVLALNVIELRPGQRAFFFAVVVLGIAALAATLSAFLSVERGVGYDDTWQLTLDAEHGGDTWLAVRVSNDDERRALLATFEALDSAPTKVEARQVQAQGAHMVEW